MELKKGDQIKTTYGDIYTVREVYDNFIWVYETNNVIHKDNVVKVWQQ